MVHPLLYNSMNNKMRTLINLTWNAKKSERKQITEPSFFALHRSALDFSLQSDAQIYLTIHDVSLVIQAENG